MISPCQHTCPVGVNVPNYVAAIASGDFAGAVDIIRERNPFPSVCGRICHHPCEARCRRGELDQPVAIRALKRFAADWNYENELPARAPFPQKRSERVAVVGAGPSGLTCAYFLAREGYPVTVFEALPEPGGMLTQALPDFRLPADIVRREIDYLVQCGITIECNSPIDPNHSLADLQLEGFQAIFLAAGAPRTQPMGIPGEPESSEGFHYGLQFLRDVRLGRKVEVGSRVAVIGGGNVALDAARTALRLGAAEVRVLYRRSRKEMPVSEEEYEHAREEGIEVEFLVGPTRLLNEDSRTAGLQCVTMALGEPDASGRRRPVALAGTEFVVEADTVIAAVGQAPDLGFLSDNGLQRTSWGTLGVDPNSLSCTAPGVFAGGDFVTGPGMVIDAIAAGRRAAIAIQKYLSGDGSPVEMFDRPTQPPEQVVEPPVAELPARPPVAEEDEDLQPRREPATMAPSLRSRCFAEVELKYSEAEARREATRCLRCDLE
jgi:NADH-quinone oxidoreductase subunit F